MKCLPQIPAPVQKPFTPQKPSSTKKEFVTTGENCVADDQTSYYYEDYTCARPEDYLTYGYDYYYSDQNYPCDTDNQTVYYEYVPQQEV